MTNQTKRKKSCAKATACTPGEKYNVKRLKASRVNFTCQGHVTFLCRFLFLVPMCHCELTRKPGQLLVT